MPESMIVKIKRGCNRLLVSRRLPIILACIAVLMASGSTGTGLQLDDYVHQDRLKHPELYNPLTELFDFSNDPQQPQEQTHFGEFPWWIAQEYHLSFFRPLTAMTHWLDSQLWPDTPALMHVHSLLWFAALIIMAALVYRKLMAAVWIAGLAGLLYAIDDAHGMPAGWIANRNALIAGVFGFLSIYLHVQWRREGWRIGAVLAPFFFLLSLLSAEAGVAAGAYLLSFELILSSDSWRRRIYSVLPYAAVALVWRISYTAMGFGAHGGGAYIDPGHNPLAFLVALFERLPLQLYGQWLFPNAAFYGFLSKPFAYVVLIGVYALLAAIFYVFLPLLKRDQLSRFWALGMLLALLPSAATFPHNRLLLFVGLGAMGLLAQFFEVWLKKPVWLPASRMWRGTARVVVAVLIWLHVITAPLMLSVESLSMAGVYKMGIEKPFVTLSQDINLRGKTVVLINPPNVYITTFVKFICEKYGLTQPERACVLASGLTSQLEIRRADANSLEIEPKNGFIAEEVERLFRGTSDPMQIGQRIDLDGMRVQILTLTQDLRPLRVRFTFTKPLEDPSFLFCEWKTDRFVPFTPPQAGHSKVIKPLLTQF